MTGKRTPFVFGRVIATLGALGLGACTTSSLPTWNANNISLGATATGVLAKEGDCVVLQGDRKILPIWPSPTHARTDGIVTPAGDLIAFGTQITLVGSYGQEGTRYWSRASNCGAIPFSVNHDGIDWTGQ